MLFAFFVYNWPPNQKFDFDLWQHCTIPIVILTMLTKGQVMDFLSCSQEGLTVMKVEFHSWFWQPWEQASVSKVWSSGSFSFLQHLSHCVGGQCAVLMGPMPSNFSNYLRRGTFVMAVIVISALIHSIRIPDGPTFTVELHKSGSSLEAIIKHLKVPWTSLQTSVCKYKNLGTKKTLNLSERRQIISQGWTNFGLKGLPEPQDSNKGTSEGLKGIRYQSMSIHLPLRESFIAMI